MSPKNIETFDTIIQWEKMEAVRQKQGRLLGELHN